MPFQKGSITQDLEKSSNNTAVNGKLTFSFSLATESSHGDEVPSGSFVALHASGPSSGGVDLHSQISQATLHSSLSRRNSSAHEESARPAMSTPTSSMFPTVRPTTAPNPQTAPASTNAQLSAGAHYGATSRSHESSARLSTAGQSAQRENILTDASGNDLPSGWERRLDDRGRNYYINRVTRESAWQSPAIAPSAPAPAPISQTVRTLATSNVNSNGGPYADISLPLGWEERRTEEGKPIILYGILSILTSSCTKAGRIL